MAKIILYRSSFFSEGEHQAAEFQTLDELLELDFIKPYLNHDGFHRFALDWRYAPEPLPFIAEYAEGKKWKLVGFIDGSLESVALPQWSLVE